MTIVLNGVSEDVAQTTQTTWQSKYSRGGVLNSGDYLVQGFCEITGSSASRLLSARLLVDGVEEGVENIYPHSAGAYQSVNFLVLKTFTGEGVYHSVEIQYQSSANQTMSIRRVRVLVTKF